MPKQTKQQPGEVRDHLVMYPGGKTWHYVVKWRGKVRKGDTKCESRTAASTWLQAEMQRWANGEVGIGGEAATPTLREIWKEWRQAKAEQVSPRHIVNMRCAVETHAKAFLDLPITALDNLAIEKLRSSYLQTKGKGYRTGQDWEAERDHSDGGANTLQKMLSSLCGWAVTVKLITSRPFHLKKLKPQQKIRAMLWPEKTALFLEKVRAMGKQWAWREDKHGPRPPHDAYIAVRLMVQLGIREDEAIHARWSWIDWRRHCFIVGASKNRRLREIEIPPKLRSLLKSICPPEPLGLILPTKTSKSGEQTPHHKNFTAKVVGHAGELAGVPGLTPHRLRAAFATAHYEKGTPISQIQQMLGHSSPETTMKYIMTRPKGQAEAQADVEKTMGIDANPAPVPIRFQQKKRKTNKHNKINKKKR